MNSIFVLIMVFQSGHGLATLQAEFNSYDACEKARIWTYKEADKSVNIRSMGCFPKSVLSKEFTK